MERIFNTWVSIHVHITHDVTPEQTLWLASSAAVPRGIQEKIAQVSIRNGSMVNRYTVPPLVWMIAVILVISIFFAAQFTVTALMCKQAFRMGVWPLGWVCDQEDGCVTRRIGVGPEYV